MKISQTKKNIIIRYIVIFIGLLFLLFGFLYNKSEKEVDNSAMSIDGFLNKVQKPTVKDVNNILLYENSENNIISINITFKGGAALDPKNYEGLSNFLANAMIMGAGNYSVSQFSKMFEEYSIKISTQVSRDSITFELTTLNYYKSRAFNLLKMILNSPNLGKEEIELTKNNLISEYNIRALQPKYLVSQAIRKQMFGENPYFRDILGNKNIINSVTPEVLKNFKEKVITKKNMYIAISGNISKNEVEKEFSSIVSSLPKGDPEFLSLDYVNPVFNNKVISIAPKGASQSEVLIAFSSPRYDSELYPYAKVLNTYLGLMPDSLLFDVLRNENGLVYTVNSLIYQDSITNYWLISLGVSLNNVDKAINLVKSTLKNIKDRKYDINNVFIAKNWMLDNELRYFTSNSNIAEFLNKRQLLGITIDKSLQYKHLYDEIDSEKIDQVLSYVNIDRMSIAKIVAEK